MVESNEAAVLANPITSLKANLVDIGIDGRLPCGIGISRLSRVLKGGSVDASKRVVVVVTRSSSQADTRLSAAAHVDCAGRERHQSGPIAAVDGDIAQLTCFDYRSNLGVALFERLRP